MAFNLDQYLPQDVAPDLDVERIIRLGKRIVGEFKSSRARRTGRRPRPVEILELQVESDQGDELVLRAYKEGHEMIAELHNGPDKIRALHTHDGHRNPMHPERLPNGHMHFPTNDYPLIAGNSSFAYEIPCSEEDNLILFIELFCAEIDIQMGPFQTTLDSARRRWTE